MKQLMALAVTASLVLAACSSPTTSVQPGRTTSQASTLKAQLVIPYRLQAPTRVAQSFNLMNYIAGEAAIAEEEAPAAEATAAPAEAAPAPADAVTTTEVQNLDASVDGADANATVTGIAASADGSETIVSVDITTDSTGEGVEVVEVTTPDGGLLGSVAVDAAPGATTTVEITPETTAVVEVAIEKHGARKIADLTEAELAALAQDPATLNKAAAVRSLFKKDGSLKPNKDRNFKRKAAKAAATPGSAAAEHKSDKGAEMSEGKGKPADAPASAAPADAPASAAPADKGNKPADKGAKPADKPAKGDDAADDADDEAGGTDAE